MANSRHHLPRHKCTKGLSTSWKLHFYPLQFQEDIYGGADRFAVLSIIVNIIFVFMLLCDGLISGMALNIE
jgi:hypothetical protein